MDLDGKVGRRLKAKLDRRISDLDWSLRSYDRTISFAGRSDNKYDLDDSDLRDLLCELREALEQQS